MSRSGGPLVVLVRHGETAWNVEHRFQGQHDTELSEEGREQARAAAEAVAGALGPGSARVVTSDLRRARATAEALGAEMALLPEVDERLREIAAGQWQGLLQHEIEALDPQGYTAWRAGEDVRLGGAERPSEAGERVRQAVTEHAVGLTRGQWLIVVGHGASIRSGLAALLGQPELRRVLVPLGNTGTAVLSPGTVASQPWRLHGWNVPPGALGDVLGRRGSASASIT